MEDIKIFSEKNLNIIIDEVRIAQRRELYLTSAMAKELMKIKNMTLINEKNKTSPNSINLLNELNFKNYDPNLDIILSEGKIINGENILFIFDLITKNPRLLIHLGFFVKEINNY